jgi:hypothetical protein
MTKEVQGGFFSVDRFNGYALHGDRYTAGCEAHKKFAMNQHA